MKKHAKQLLSLLLALTMVMALAACGKTGSASTSGGDDEQITLTIGVPASTLVTDYEDNYLTKWLEEKTGYNLDFEFFSNTLADRKTQLATMIAAGEKLPDIMFSFGLDDNERNQYGGEGYFLDLAPYFDDEEVMARYADKLGYSWWDYVKENISAEQVQQMNIQARDMEGRWWGFPYMTGSINDLPRNHMYINKVWLEKLGLEIPTNFDEFVTVLEAFKTQDPNGNGIADEIPLLGSSSIYRSDLLTWLTNQYVYFDHDHPCNIGEGGKLYMPHTSEGFRQGLKDCNLLYEKGLLSPMYFSAKTPDMQALFTPANGVALVGVMCGTLYSVATAGSDVMYEYTHLAPFEGATPAIGPAVNKFNTYISSDCEHPDEAFELLLILSSFEGVRFQQNGAEDVHYVRGVDYRDPNYTGIYKTVDLSKPHNAHWGTTGVGAYWVNHIGDGQNEGPTNEITPEAPADGSVGLSWASERYWLIYHHAQANLEAAEKNNPEVFYTIYTKYTPEEVTERNAGKVPALNYHNETRAKFISGELDIDDDKAWEEYCETFMQTGGAQWLDVTQRSYERTAELIANLPEV